MMKRCHPLLLLIPALILSLLLASCKNGGAETPTTETPTETEAAADETAAPAAQTTLPEETAAEEAAADLTEEPIEETDAPAEDADAAADEAFQLTGDPAKDYVALEGVWRHTQETVITLTVAADGAFQMELRGETYEGTLELYQDELAEDALPAYQLVLGSGRTIPDSGTLFTLPSEPGILMFGYAGENFMLKR